MNDDEDLDSTNQFDLVYDGWTELKMHLEVETSEAAHGLEDESWLDRWWPLFLIIFGVSCILFVATFTASY